MNIDKFLDFWSRHNVGIIEALIAAIVFAVVVLVYSMIFGKKSEANIDGGGASIDTAQIEKTLQKILDAQATAKPAAGASAEAISASPAAVAAAAPEVAAELENLRKTLQEKQSQIEELKVKADTATAAAASASASGVVAPGAGGAGLSAEEKQAYETKIKDLEARLAEYEIISEDIADLSKFKEENVRLQKELDALKAGGATAAPAAPAPAAVATPPPPPPTPAAGPAADVPVVGEDKNVVDDDLMKEFAAAVQNQKAAAPAEEAPAAPATAPVVGEGVVDDDLMKEFAAAVVDQKAAPAVSTDTEQLMNDFENFNKKS